MPSGDLIIERNAALNELAGKEHFTPIKNINDANANLVKEVITALIDAISIRHKDELAQLIESNILPSKTASPAWSQNSENIILLIRRDLALLRNCCSALFEGTDDSIFTPAAARHHGGPRLRSYQRPPRSRGARQRDRRLLTR